MIRVYYELFEGPPNWDTFYNIPFPVFYKLTKDKLKAEQKKIEQLQKQREQMNRKLAKGTK